MLLKTIKTYEAAIQINILFAVANILGVMPDWIMPGNPQTDAEYDAKIKLVYLFFAIKFFLPYLIVAYYWAKKDRITTDVIDWAYLGLFIGTCAKDCVDIFTDPSASTHSDWMWFFPLWVILTLVKIGPIIRHFKSKLFFWI